MNYLACVNPIYQTYPLVKKIIEVLKNVNAIPILVGGAVRDFFLNQPTKDFDIEVYNISLDQLNNVFAQFGPVNFIGKSFGVFKLHGIPIDWSLPRQDSKGRKPQVIINEQLSFHEAFIRRDLTINAMGIDFMTGALIDPFNGKKDLEEKILRAPDVRFFVEDPLRFFRVMQFVGRLEMNPDETLNQLCSHMELAGVSRERISDEFEKLLLKSSSPSRGFRWLASIERLHEILPELDTLRSVCQRPDYHPEGNVFEHTMQTLDAAAIIARSYKNKTKKLTLLFSALCHDIGKTGGKNEHGHDIRGASLAPRLLSRLTISKKYIAPVQKLVRHHMVPLLFTKQNASHAAYKRLANVLEPEVNIKILGDLATADRQGRNPNNQAPLTHIDQEIFQFKQRAIDALVFFEAEKPILQGKDLLDYVDPGKIIGKLLDYAYNIQIEEGIQDKEILKTRVLQKLKRY